MFILRMLVKILLIPVFLMVCFIRTWVELLSRIGCVILGLFYLLMLAIIIMYITKQMWGAVVLSVIIFFWSVPYHICSRSCRNGFGWYR